MKKLFLLALLTFVVGCNQINTRTDWYVPQGFNLSECGPAVAAMAARWSKGDDTTRFHARAYNTSGVNLFRWWDLHTVRSYLVGRGVKTKFVSIDTPLPQGQMGVYNVGSHFVAVVISTKGELQVGDPLKGLYTESIDEFMSSSPVGETYLMIVK